MRVTSHHFVENLFLRTPRSITWYCTLQIQCHFTFFYIKEGSDWNLCERTEELIFEPWCLGGVWWMLFKWLSVFLPWTTGDLWGTKKHPVAGKSPGSAVLLRVSALKAQEKCHFHYWLIQTSSSSPILLPRWTVKLDMWCHLVGTRRKDSVQVLEFPSC